MFSLMDRVERGIDDMLRYLEEHIKHQGLADMIISANIITTVCAQLYCSNCVANIISFFLSTKIVQPWILCHMNGFFPSYH